MKELAKGLCDRTNNLKANATKPDYPINVSALVENARNFTNKGREAFERQTFYSSASYCFGANVEYSTLILLSKNLSKNEAIKETERIKEEIKKFENKLESFNKKTITDLEAYIVVKERLAEAEDSANRAIDTLNKTNSTAKIARELAYASERVNSAYSWATFLGKSGKEFNLDKEVLKKTCQTKISEADEREQYVELYFPGTLDNIKEGIDKANKELEKGNFEACLSIASKAKADVDVILSVFGVGSEHYSAIIDGKLDIVKNNIARQASKGIFPILGYSYYEYANSLKNSDVISALLYSEYALELGNLDIYFRENTKKSRSFNIDKKLAWVFLAGVLTGIAAALLIKRRTSGINSKTRRKK